MTNLHRQNRLLPMSPIQSHRDLVVWQKAVRLTGMIATLTKQFPIEEHF